MELKIVSLKGKQFNGNNVIAECKGGFAFYHDLKGYVSFIASNEKNGVKTPYTNKKKVLQSILNEGGLINYNNVEWLHSIN